MEQGFKIAFAPISRHRRPRRLAPARLKSHQQGDKTTIGKTKSFFLVPCFASLTERYLYRTRHPVGSRKLGFIPLGSIISLIPSRQIGLGEAPAHENQGRESSSTVDLRYCRSVKSPRHKPGQASTSPGKPSSLVRAIRATLSNRLARSLVVHQAESQRASWSPSSCASRLKSVHQARAYELAPANHDPEQQSGCLPYSLVAQNLLEAAALTH